MMVVHDAGCWVLVRIRELLNNLGGSPTGIESTKAMLPSYVAIKCRLDITRKELMFKRPKRPVGSKKYPSLRRLM